MSRSTTLVMAIGSVVIALACSACSGGKRAMPVATPARFPDLAYLVQFAKDEIRTDSVGPVQKAMVFSTTRLAANQAGPGANPNPPNGRVEVVVLQGEFVYRASHGPPGSVIRGRVITAVFDPSRGGTDLGVVNGLPGPQMGTAYALPVG